MTWDEARFFPAFARAGMTVSASVLYAGTETAIVRDVLFCKPDVFTTPGVQFSDYEMEYQTADFESLAEGDQVEIGDALYIVRQPKWVDGNEATGFFSKALLTKTSGNCG